MYYELVGATPIYCLSHLCDLKVIKLRNWHLYKILCLGI